MLGTGSFGIVPSMPDDSSERWDSIFRQLSSMSAEERAELLKYLGTVELHAGAQLSGEGTLTAGPPRQRAPGQLSGEGTLTAVGVVDEPPRV